MKILVTGGSSYLGQHLVPMAMAAGHELIYTTYASDPLGLPNRRQLDVRDENAVVNLCRDVRPTAIMHLAGSNRNEDMENVITAGAKNMVHGANITDAKLLFISSDVIFDGTAAPYSEAATPTPLHAYGRAKVAAERIVSHYANHAILRTSLIYSTTIMDRGTEWMKSTLAKQQPITLFTNQVRQPIHADDLSRACLALAENQFTGILNVVGRDVVSRAVFGRCLLTHWRIPITELVQFSPDHSGRWPLDTRLNRAHATRILPFPLRGLADYLTIT